MSLVVDGGGSGLVPRMNPQCWSPEVLANCCFNTFLSFISSALSQCVYILVSFTSNEIDKESKDRDGEKNKSGTVSHSFRNPTHGGII